MLEVGREQKLEGGYKLRMVNSPLRAYLVVRGAMAGLLERGHQGLSEGIAVPSQARVAGAEARRHANLVPISYIEGRRKIPWTPYILSSI